MCSNISSKCFHVKDSLGMKLKQLVLIFYLVRMCCQKKKKTSANKNYLPFSDKK